MSPAASPRKSGRPLRILQLHGRFDGSAKDRRIIRLMNHWGDKAKHDLLLADPDADSARAGIDPSVPVQFLDGPPFGPRGGPGRFVALAQLMRGYDLVLSFGWGGMDALITQRLLGLLMSLPPLIHHEDGADLNEVGPLGLSSDFYRRASLSSAHALVVPNGHLAHRAIDEWGERANHVRQIPDGIPVAAYAKPSPPTVIPGLVGDGRLILGACTVDASPDMIDLLLCAVAPLSDKVRLVLLDAPGEGKVLGDRATALGIADLVVPDSLPPAPELLGALDLFLLLSRTDPAPPMLAEALAAGLPVIAGDTRDVVDMICSPNRPYIVPQGDERALTAAIGRLVDDPDLRARIGQANRKRAAQCFDEKVMYDLYARLYGSAVAREDALL